jgi:hypothetical protein
MARGSARELEAHMIIAADLGYVTAEAFASVIRPLMEVQAMLTVMRRRLSRANEDQRPRAPRPEVDDWRLRHQIDA